MEFDENLVSLEVNMKRAEDRTIVNVRAEQFEDIEDPIIVHVSHFERINTGEYQHLVNTSANICNLFGRVKSHPILRIILKELLKSSNFPTACPVKKVIEVDLKRVFK